MRPVSLQLEGFAAFKNPTTVDFRDLELVAFVGSTGAGKSSLIDAITFALYGSVSRYEKMNVVAPVIHQLSNEAKVRFDFEVEGTVYTAVRVVRRLKSEPGKKARASTKEARLERVVGEKSETLAGNVKELDTQVEQLLGLNFAQFTRTAVLPQGEFAKFLKDDPADRQKLIRRLLDIEVYAQMGSKAREKAKLAKQKISFLEQEKQRYSADSEKLLKDAERSLRKIEIFSTNVDASVERIEQVDVVLDPLREQVIEIDDSIGSLENILERQDRMALLPQGALSEVQQQLEEKREELKEVRSARGAVLESLKGYESAEVLQTKIRRLLAVDDQKQIVERLLQDEKNCVSQKNDREKKLQESQSRQQAAETRWLDSLEKSKVFHIRKKLQKGDACPVCEQTISIVPEKKMLEVSESAELEKIDAAQKVSKFLQEVAEFAGKQKAFEKERKKSEQTVQDLLKETSGFASISVLEEKITLWEKKQKEKERIEKLVVLKDKEAAKATDTLVAFQEKENNFQSQFFSLREQVAQLKPPALDGKNLREEFQLFLEWAEKSKVSLQDERLDLAEKGRKAAEDRAQLIDALCTDASDVGISSTSYEEVLVGVREKKMQTQRKIDKYARACSESARLKDEQRVLQTEVEKLEVLGRHLSVSGFEAWLQSEALEEITARATESLQTFSRGQYSLQIRDRAFFIIDHANAGESREVRSLSGGETFLVSLALALALSDSIRELSSADSSAVGSVALGSIFLDEGFGTLDEETLDIAASAIEELSATGRMVGVVTHVRELAERLPVRFEVRKNSMSAFVERVEQG